jgi:ABC-2 type transport system permease protein
MLPFLLSTIFFSMSLSIFIKNRETGFIAFLFSSVVLLFLSGIPWPRSNMPDIWRYFSYIFPATHGVQGYVKLNSTGATLSQIQFEYIALWIQSALYFIFASFTLNYLVKESKVANEIIDNQTKSE